jgi:hypothetical protein
MPHKKDDPAKSCETCDTPLERKRFGTRLEDRNVFLRRRFCSLSCANTKTDVAKDTLHWRARKHRKPNCETCQTKRDLHVHHIDRNPANNDPINLATLCASCHLKLHWREDRAQRLAGVAKAQVTAVASGGNIRQRSTDGKFSKAD